MSRDDELGTIQNEVAELEEEVLRFGIDYYSKHYALPAARWCYWRAWHRQTQYAVRAFPGRPDLECRLIRHVIDAFANPPGKTHPERVSSRLGAIAHGTQGLQRYRPEEKSGQRQRGVWVELCRDLTTHADPFVQIVAYHGLICLGEDKLASARACRCEHFEQLAWAGDVILGHTTMQGLILLDPRSAKNTWLLGGVSSSKPFGCASKPILGLSGLPAWPAVWDGDVCLAGGGFRLTAFAEGEPAARHPEIQYVRFLEPTPYGLLAIGQHGAWLTRRKAGAQDAPGSAEAGGAIGESSPD